MAMAMPLFILLERTCNKVMTSLRWLRNVISHGAAASQIQVYSLEELGVWGKMDFDRGETNCT